MGRNGSCNWEHAGEGWWCLQEIVDAVIHMIIHVVVGPAAC
jgi:hypothetical protein